METEKIISHAYSLRLERQHILLPIGKKDDYNTLFRLLSPVQPCYWTEPGQAPFLPMRADFDDMEYNHKRRAERKILKGRFQKGNIAYVEYQDLSLFACAYRKDKPTVSYEEIRMLDLLRMEGPLNIGSIKEITGMLVKNITPILHKLQKNFLAYEDQIDNEGDRAWYVLESEFPEIDLNSYTRTEAITSIIQRFLQAFVFALPEEIKSFYGFAAKDINEALGRLAAEKTILQIGGGYILTQDYEELQSYKGSVPRFVLLLNRNDFLAKSAEYANKERFTRTVGERACEILHYLLIDGQIRGALMGWFKFGPWIIEDVLLDLPKQEQLERKTEILQAIYNEYDQKLSPVKRYCGQAEDGYII